jgi:hypothetical protein
LYRILGNIKAAEDAGEGARDKTSLLAEDPAEL